MLKQVLSKCLCCTELHKAILTCTKLPAMLPNHNSLITHYLRAMVRFRTLTYTSSSHLFAFSHYKNPILCHCWWFQQKLIEQKSIQFPKRAQCRNLLQTCLTYYRGREVSVEEDLKTVRYSPFSGPRGQNTPIHVVDLFHRWLIFFLLWCSWQL